MTDADRGVVGRRAPWISRDLYAEVEFTTGRHEKIRIEVRASRLNPAVEASLVYCVYRWEDGSWLEIKGDDVPDDAAREGSRLVASARRVDLAAAQFGEGPSVDRTGDLRQGVIDLSEPLGAGGLECDRCGRDLPVGEHHGHGFEVLCEGCYGGRYDAHVAGIAAAMLEGPGEAASEELRDLEDRFGDDYAEDVRRGAERRVQRRLGGETPSPPMR